MRNPRNPPSNGAFSSLSMFCGGCLMNLRFGGGDSPAAAAWDSRRSHMKLRRVCSCLPLSILVLGVLGSTCVASPRIHVDFKNSRLADHKVDFMLRGIYLFQIRYLSVLLNDRNLMVEPDGIRITERDSIYLAADLPSTFQGGDASLELVMGDGQRVWSQTVNFPDMLTGIGKQPEIIEVKPWGEYPGNSVTIIGKHFGDNIKNVVVVFGGTESDDWITTLGKKFQSALGYKGSPDLNLYNEFSKPLILRNSETSEHAEIVTILNGKLNDKSASLSRTMYVTVQVNGVRAGNWVKVNLVNLSGTFRAGLLAAAIVFLLMAPLFANWPWAILAPLVFMGGAALFHELLPDKWFWAPLFMIVAGLVILCAKLAGSCEKVTLGNLLRDGSTNAYSLSKLQAFAWTVVLMWSYALLGIGSGLLVGKGSIPDFNASLLGLMSVSYGGLLFSQGIASRGRKREPAQQKPELIDLIREHGEISLPRLQLLGFTAISIAIYLYYLYSPDIFSKGLPDVPATLVTLMGISQGGYLGGKHIAQTSDGGSDREPDQTKPAEKGTQAG